MRCIFLILFLASCSEKEQDAIVFEQDTIMLQSEQRTKAMLKVLPEVDNVIHKEEQRIEHDLKSLESEVQSLKVSQEKTKVIYIHDTILIKEKTNFWGRKKISVDSSISIDSLEYN
jgi:uncharacterized protein YjcR